MSSENSQRPPASENLIHPSNFQPLTLDLEASTSNNSSAPSETVVDKTPPPALLKDNTRIVLETDPIFNQHPSFKLDIVTLQELTDNRDNQLLEKLGGLDGLVQHLRTDLMSGLVSDESGIPGEDQCTDRQPHDDLPDGHLLDAAFVARRHAYGTNFISPPPPPSFFQLCFEQLKDRMLQILLVAALVSIGVGIFMVYTRIGDPTEWIEGVAILCTVAFVILVNAGNDYKKALQFRFLSSQRGLTSIITVTRRLNKTTEPAKTTIPIMHLQVGDIVHLSTGDVVPADGVFIHGSQCKADEASVTGETDAVSKKLNGDRYLISGSKIIEGICTYVVTSVGPHSLAGRSLMALRSGETALTPLQVKLTDLADSIAKYGIAAAGFIVVVSFIKFFIVFGRTGFQQDQDGNPVSAGVLVERVIKIFITGVTVIVVAVPEGLPMAVTLALAYATIQMLKDQNLVRVLSACETMGGATTICSDKTGTLTQNKMTVVEGSFFNGGVSFDTQEQLRTRMMDPNVSLHARQLLTQSMNINSTAYEGVDESGLKILVGSKTECALLEMTSLLSSSFNLDRQAMVQVGALPFSSERKRMSTIISKTQSNSQDISFNIQLPGSQEAPIHGKARMFTKGASELVLASCRWMVNEEGRVVELSKERLAWIESKILAYATNALRTIGMAYKDVDTPESGADVDSNLDQANLVWLGVAGIEDPLRPEVPPAVGRCQGAGIMVRMVTGDNAVTARNIAKRCGILVDEERDIVMEGVQFRVLSDLEMKRILPRLCVLARSSPLDKRILVNKLKEMGQTVAVTGDGTNDAPALKAADVGFAMGIAGTEVAKEASDIILMDDNFASLAKAVMWGRSVYDAVRKFLQFQLSVNVTAVGLAMITATVDSKSRTIISAVQLLWVNLIMDTMAALALATDPPTEELLNRKPHKKSDPLISYNMSKMIVLQSIYQIAICVVLTYAGPQIFGFSEQELANNPRSFPFLASEYDELDQMRAADPTLTEQWLSEQQSLARSNYFHWHVSAIVFNTFVWMTVFNIFNGRTLYKELNVFSRIFYNKFFTPIILIIIILQTVIIQFGSSAFGVIPLTGIEWAASIVLGFISLPLGVIIKLIPDVGSGWYNTKFYINDDDPTRARDAWQEAIRKTQLQSMAVRAFRTYRKDAPGVVIMQ